MATPVLIPVEEYLRTTYRPDRDYIDGELKERNLGETPHSTIQSIFVVIFHANRRSWGLRAFTEQRVQTSETHYRIPDVCAIRVGTPPGPIVRSAPVVCIEILSPGDSRSDLLERVDDYVGMGVENIWILDPLRRRAWSADANGIHKLVGDAFTVPGTPVRIPLSDLYAELDDLAAGR
jgi:Uma2 family endonuclease